MYFATGSDVCVMALFLSDRLGVGRQMILEAVGKFVLWEITVKKAGGTGQQDAFVKLQQEVGSNRQWSEFAYNMETLLGSFIDQ